SDTVAMFRAERNRLPKAERIAFQYAGFRSPALGLVDQQNYRGSGTTQPAGNFFIKRGQTSAAINDKQSHFGSGNCHLRLLPHPSGKTFGVFILVTGCVDYVEFKPQQVSRTLPPVACNAGTVIDQSQLLADQPVE